MDSVTRIFYINLDHRTDRNQEMIDQFQKYGIQNYERFQAIADLANNRGCVGCTKSHIAVLKLILQKYPLLENKNNSFIIMEDDFTFHEPFSTLGVPKELDYNVILLASNTIRSEASDYSFLRKALEVQTTSGYLIRGDYVTKLLANFEEGLIRLEENFSKGEPPYCCIDQYWKRLQSDKWFIFEPCIGYQRASFSDVGQGYTDPQKRY